MNNGEIQVIINCSKSEGMSCVLMEAMNSGKSLIIARNIQGNQSIIKDKYNGNSFLMHKDK